MFSASSVLFHRTSTWTVRSLHSEHSSMNLQLKVVLRHCWTRSLKNSETFREKLQKVFRLLVSVDSHSEHVWAEFIIAHLILKSWSLSHLFPRESWPHPADHISVIISIDVHNIYRLLEKLTEFLRINNFLVWSEISVYCINFNCRVLAKMIHRKRSGLQMKIGNFWDILICCGWQIETFTLTKLS